MAGSHRGPWLLPRAFLRQEPRWFPKGSRAELPDIDADRSAFDILRFSLAPGDAIFFDFLAVHAAPRVPTGAAGASCRCGTCQLTPGSRHVPGAPSPPFDSQEEQLPAGAPMDHPLFPVVWPA